MEPARVFNFIPSFLAVLSMATLACGTSPKESPGGSAPPAVSGEPAGLASVEGSVDGGSVITNFGVPECDAYVAKYMACLDEKVSAEAKERLLATFEMNRTKWRAMSTMKGGAAALSTVCLAATQKAKETLFVEYGCEF
jgi:hypothetical protein